MCDLIAVCENQLNIAIIDADLIGRSKHRFPNLASMKISGYYKQLGYNVVLKLDYEGLEHYDRVFISKVFTETKVPDIVLEMENVEYGGTGFFYDKATPLPCEIEHHMPDYHLYDDWVNEQIESGRKRNEFEYYLDYSIGFTTRGCFRKCEFCVNKNYTYVSKHSSLDEFYDKTRKYICLLDDNILGYPKWKEIFNDLIATGKYFQYKQGMDERILNDEKCEILSKCKYRGDYIFAFDNIDDSEIIKEKLTLWKKYVKKTTKFYVFCGFDRSNKYDDDFWRQDIIDTLERIKILMEYGCNPYIMRHKNYENSPHRGMYITLAKWCNQPNFYKKCSLIQYCRDVSGNGYNSPSWKYIERFKLDHPDIAEKYYNLRYEDLNKYLK